MSSPVRSAAQPTVAPLPTTSSGEIGTAPADTTLSTDDLVSRLVAHRTIGQAPRNELAWVAAHGHLRRFEAGETVSRHSESVKGLYIVLSGRVAIFAPRGGGRHKIDEWRAGDVTGLLPYSRLMSPPGDTIVEEPAELLIVTREDLPELIRACQAVTAILVHIMLDRTRHFTSSQLHDEKLLSLGKLAASLAHELNNPAAAIRRSAKLVSESLDRAESAARALGLSGLLAEEIDAVQRARDRCLATTKDRVRSPLEEAEREAEMIDWLSTHGIGAPSADALAETPITLEGLDRLAASVRSNVLGPALAWVTADCSVRSLATEIEQASLRISNLVSAVKGFTQLDASTVAQPVDIGEGLVQTLAVLRGKARAKGVSVAVEAEDGLPRVHGYAAELNQIWANLIDNAIDAAPASGRVTVVARHEGPAVVVRVVDNGAGIPPDLRDRIFDPFFTTKDVGQGTGLGLDIVRRLVARHDGDIEVRSQPGQTEFIVSLPVADHGPDGGPR